MEMHQRISHADETTVEEESKKGRASETALRSLDSTNADPWGPTQQQMQEICDACHGYEVHEGFCPLEFFCIFLRDWVTLECLPANVPYSLSPFNFLDIGTQVACYQKTLFFRVPGKASPQQSPKHHFFGPK